MKKLAKIACALAIVAALATLTATPSEAGVGWGRQNTSTVDTPQTAMSAYLREVVLVISQIF